MRRAVSVSLCLTTAFYLSVSVVGYATFGNRVCEDIVTCFGKAPDGSPSSVPSGLIQAINVMVRAPPSGLMGAWCALKPATVATPSLPPLKASPWAGASACRQRRPVAVCQPPRCACCADNGTAGSPTRRTRPRPPACLRAPPQVVVHLVPAYAVYTQPLFAFVEGGVAHSRRLRRWLPAALSPARRASRWSFRLVFRSLYVVVVAVIAVVLPFFSAIVGLVGALGFWPATVAYPIRMYRRKHRPTGRQLWTLHAVDWACLAVSVFAVVGSVRRWVVRGGAGGAGSCGGAGSAGAGGRGEAGGCTPAKRTLSLHARPAAARHLSATACSPPTRPTMRWTALCCPTRLIQTS